MLRVLVFLLLCPFATRETGTSPLWIVPVVPLGNLSSSLQPRDESPDSNGFTVCTYNGEADPCTYASDGEFVNGPSSCHLLIRPQQSPIPLPPDPHCPPTNKVNGKLQAKGGIAGIITCTYPGDPIFFKDTNDTCSYPPPEHNLLGGPPDKCPSTLGPTPLPDPGPGCPFTNNSGEKLAADTGDEQGVITCTYTNEVDPCLYVDAKLIRGPSNCPPLTPDPGISAGIAAVAIQDDTPSRNSSIVNDNIGDKKMGATQPILIALLVVNGVTAFVILTIAGISGTIRTFAVETRRDHFVIVTRTQVTVPVYVEHNIQLYSDNPPSGTGPFGSDSFTCLMSNQVDSGFAWAFWECGENSIHYPPDGGQIAALGECATTSSATTSCHLE
ncbi:hypothetical protein MVEN_00062500 [Mycena venus]|uniref:Uncharacterized protein n=1 Tax=Mycena venus TaxID=2733690 RepID=A0A8H7DGA0_9AGAR|nr:hypothetical protein MVEN_00062500 [Mycena venus]